LLEHPRIRVGIKEQVLTQREASLTKREEACRIKEEQLAQKDIELTKLLKDAEQRIRDAELRESPRVPFSKISPTSNRLNRKSETPIKAEKSMLPSHPGTPLSTLAGKMKTLTIVTPGRQELTSSGGSLASTRKWLGKRSELETPKHKTIKPFQSPMQTSP
jgi:hypothetical protein